MDLKQAHEQGSIDEWLDASLKTQEQLMGSIQSDREIIHRVFVQNPEGQKLLTKWTDQLLMVPSIDPNSTVFGAGLSEGAKNFVRNILIAIKQVERDS